MAPNGTVSHEFNIKQATEIFCLFSVLTKSLFLENKCFVKAGSVFVRSLEMSCFLEKNLFYQKKQKIHVLLHVYFPQQQGVVIFQSSRRINELKQKITDKILLTTKFLKFTFQKVF